MPSSNQKRQQPRKVVRFAAKIKPTWRVSSMVVNGEEQDVGPLQPSSPERWWMELECSPSDAKVLERILRANGSTTTKVRDA